MTNGGFEPVSQGFRGLLENYLDARVIPRPVYDSENLGGLDFAHAMALTKFEIHDDTHHRALTRAAGSEAGTVRWAAESRRA